MVDELEFVTGALRDGVAVVTIVVSEVDVCAIATTVMMPSAAAPARRNLVICHTFQQSGNECLRLGLVVHH
jgi:hypothetical protein